MKNLISTFFLITLFFSSNLISGELYSWGSNSDLQLGIGDAFTPGEIDSAVNCLQVACGERHTAVIRLDGTLWALGENFHGQLGDGTTITRNQLVQIGTNNNWKQVVCGENFTIAIQNNGTLWGWGYNYNGQLGDGTNITRYTPVRIGIDSNWKQIACGYRRSVAIKTDSTLWAWGFNNYRQLGDGTDSTRYSPVKIGNAYGWIKVAACENHTIAIFKNKTDYYTLWAWGKNEYGQLGDGTKIDRLYPTMIGLDTIWSDISCGAYHSLGMKSNGSIWSWGQNYYGQLGDGTNIDRLSPDVVNSETNWSKIFCLYSHSFAIKNDGSLWAFGSNQYGQLGDGTRKDRNIPVKILWRKDYKWNNMACGYAHSAGIRSNGKLYTWGSYVVLPFPTSTAGFSIKYASRSVPTKIENNSNWLQIACGNKHTIATKTDSTLWTWGENSSGQNGDNTDTTRSYPIQIMKGTYWSVVASGGLDNGNTSSSSHSVCIRNDGTLWAWGSNNYGELGDGTNINKFVPTQIGSNSDWAKVACGGWHTVAIKNDGSLWTWGRNEYGQLGDSTTTNSNIPKQIGTAKDWAVVACGSSHTLCIKTDGTLWAFGRGEWGQLGNGGGHRKFPVKIGSDNNWADIDAGTIHTIAIKSNGTIWGWGYNSNGQVGDGTTTHRYTPVQIGSDANWSKIACAGDFTIALKNTGTIWTWGLYSPIIKNPTQIGTNTNWSKIACGSYHSVALLNTIPEISTELATNISNISAYSGGNIISNGGLSIVERGICWNTIGNPTISDSKKVDYNSNALFSSFITGLRGSTTYYVRAFATNSVGTAYGNEISFTTNEPEVPELTTVSITSITSSEAKSGGEIINDGGDDIIAKGICWNTSENPTISNSKTSDGSGMGSFTSRLTNLQKDTEYYVRAYSTNSIGTSYGNEISFKTPSMEIAFKTGWNFVSSFVEPDSSDLLPDVTAELNPNLVIMKNANGKIYMPGGVNQIGSWNVKEGYQAYTTKNDTLGIFGTSVVPEDTPIYLNNGWSIIPYLRNTQLNIVTALASITDAGRLIIAKKIDGKIYMPGGVNQIGNMNSGEGFQVYLNAKDTLIFPPNSIGRVSSTNQFEDYEARNLKSDYENTGNNASLILDINLPDNTEIVVVNIDKKIIGVSRVVNCKTAIVLWGDDEYTEITDGALENAGLEILKYENGIFTEIRNLEFKNIISGKINNKLNYQKNAVIIGNIISELQFSLQIKPNPANQFVELEINTPDFHSSNLKIFNLNGEIVADLTSHLKKFSSNIIEFDTSNLSSGEYVIILSYGSENILQKFVVIK